MNTSTAQIDRKTTPRPIPAWVPEHRRHFITIQCRQPDFFEHQIRNQAEFTKTFNYVLHNPIRKGLVTDWRTWPHKYICGDG